MAVVAQNGAGVDVFDGLSASPVAFGLKIPGPDQKPGDDQVEHDKSGADKDHKGEPGIFLDPQDI